MVLAVLVFLLEHGLALEVREMSLARVRSLPTHAEVVIPWDQVRTVTCDMRLVRFAGTGAEEQEARLVIAGGGDSIVVNSTRYAVKGNGVRLILERAEASAIGWSLDQIARTGQVVLGPVHLSRREISWSHGSAGHERLVRVSIDNGEVRLETADGEKRFFLRNVPNGLYLPRIVQSIQALNRSTDSRGAPQA